jgi:hypothetical protein
LKTFLSPSGSRKKQIKINNSVKNQKGKETKDIWLPSSPFMLEMKKKKKKL